MLALSRTTGIILIVGGLIFLIVAGAILLARRGTTQRGETEPEIPRAMRPAPSDADLETPLLNKLQGWSVLLVVFFVLWIPMTWLFEPERNYGQEGALLTDSVERGKHAVELYSEENQGGVGCVRCHGEGLHGSTILNTTTNTPIPTPNLTTVCGGPWTGHPAIHGLDDIYATIEQGRSGTPMPSWSIRYAGAMDDQQISDIVNYIVSIQDESQVTFNHNVCINEKAQAAADEQFPNQPPPTGTGPTA
jgi:mono/diheme cytochrome c family protein